MWSYQAYDVVQTQSPVLISMAFATLSLVMLLLAIQFRKVRKLYENQEKLGIEQLGLLRTVREMQAELDRLNPNNNITIQNPLKAPPRPRKHLPSEITCPKCRKTSHNPNDITNNYCGNCHWWTSDPHLAGINPDDLAKNLRVDPLPKRPRKKGTPR